MRIQDAHWVPGTLQQTWSALMDPKVLNQCVPHCSGFTANSPVRYQFTLKPMESQGELLVGDQSAPHHCNLMFQSPGQDGPLIGAVNIDLAEADGGTRVAYEVVAQVGGRAADLQDRSLRRTADRAIGRFMVAFTDYISKQPRLAVAAPLSADETTDHSFANSRWSWIVVVLIVALVVSAHYF